MHLARAAGLVGVIVLIGATAGCPAVEQQAGGHDLEVQQADAKLAGDLAVALDQAMAGPDLATASLGDLATAPAGDLATGIDLIAPPSSVPGDPIAFAKNDPFTLDSGTTNYVYVPTAYDGTHQTPITLFVWLHGCGGYSEGDVWTVSPGGSAQSWITLAVGGQEGNCWDMDADPARVLAAIAELKTHFNIKPRGVVMGGYSSGGDLSYRTAFYNALDFAGILVANTSPFRDTGSSQSASIAAADWKFNVVHLAHLQDDTYPIAGVRTETNALDAAGFPMTRIEVEGEHWNNPGDQVNGHSMPGTSADIATYLFPYLDDGWMAP